MITGALVTSLLEILAACWLLGYVFARAGLPFMLGQLLAGLIIGPAMLGLVQPSETLDLLAEFGIFFVMFHAGMELDPKLMVKHMVPSFCVAVGGFVLPFLLGYAVTRLMGGTVFQSLFVGLGISVTAIAVQAVVLQSMQINRSQLGHIIIGAAIVDDILSLLGLSLLLSVVSHGSVELVKISLLLAKVFGFFSLTIFLGYFIMPKFTKRLTDETAGVFTFAIGIGLAMAHLAEMAGLHHVIGAFLAGQFVRRDIMNQEVYEAVQTRFYGISYGFLVPVFFVSLSFHLRFVWDMDFIFFTVIVILISIVGKLLGAGLPLRLFGHSNWESAVVGFGMNGRGAVELVIASVVLNLSRELLNTGTISSPLLTDHQFSSLIVMAFVTTLLAPVALKWTVLQTCRHDESVDFCALLETAPRH